MDPGSRITGFGVIDFRANHATHVDAGTIDTRGETLAERLQCIYRGLESLVLEHRPAEMAIEQVFMHRNADSALKLGHARGAALLAGANLGLPIAEYSAGQIKQAVTGRGRAEKAQVQHMIKMILCLPGLPKTDAADALAVAVCHGHTRETLERMSATARIVGGRRR